MRRFRTYACFQTVGSSCAVIVSRLVRVRTNIFAFDCALVSLNAPIPNGCLSSAQATISCDGQGLLYSHVIHIICNLRSGASVETRQARLR